MIYLMMLLSCFLQHFHAFELKEREKGQRCCEGADSGGEQCAEHRHLPQWVAELALDIPHIDFRFFFSSIIFQTFFW